MTDEDLERSEQGRRAAELALVRVAHHYGGRPEFVLLGGLVPALLCSRSDSRHAGTTDVDVQVNLEIARGSVDARRLERALLNAEFVPGGEYVWRWKLAGSTTLIKFELLADLDDQPNEAVVEFDDCDELGAINVRGTGFVVGYGTRWWTCSRKAGSDELSALSDVSPVPQRLARQDPSLPSLVEAGLWGGAVVVRARLGADRVAAWP